MRNMYRVTDMDQMRNEEVLKRTCVTRVGGLRRAECVEVVWTLGENGGGPICEENNRIRCERCEVERKAMNRMDGQCEKSVE